MDYLVERFVEIGAYSRKDGCKAVDGIFYGQCEVEEEMVCVKEKTGGNVMQNPCDEDATYDGHKGAGYQVEISETWNWDNDVQIITSAIPVTAAESDAGNVKEVLDDLGANGLLPELMRSDSL